MNDNSGQVAPVLECRESLATGEVIRHQSAPGLTKRELFAAMAMQGLLANHAHAGMVNAHEQRSKVAVEAADALHAELAK